ncbi:MAG: tRNA-specific 2-thiouridylase MnmA [Acidimicrobiales bacterium]|nr:MAG: tRNA 2-thiouridine(34) synthase MnmA [Actinomycetota bacterium]MBV6509321.1 tRNA-specific 2-thiouridylase MnmA [Acidimicrobiales bacterium]RIK03954.1 MAG: tRNA 2-thiouridine(34) synthase MnmA [Acidobacteriota bacterium]
MRVLVAMSGGVDSSVATALLRDQGHEVTGVTMKLWGGDSDTGCCSVAEVDDARRVAQQLGIDHHVFNFGDEFDAKVVQPYVAAHARGDTPNPCVECNRHIKFDKLFLRAQVLGFDAVATGHHARVVTTEEGRRIGRGADTTKDQSYVLYMLDQDKLGRLLLPVGDLRKEEVRALAGRLALRTASKPDSQDVCFITKRRGRASFLGERIELHRGRLVDGAGAQVGSVDTIELVTVGQRKGLGLGGLGEPRFAVEVDVPSRTVTIGSRDELSCQGIELTELCWAGAAYEGPVMAQCSAHGSSRPGRLVGSTLTWDTAHPRVAPGQSVVFYQGDTVLGGGLAVRNLAGLRVR